MTALASGSSVTLALYDGGQINVATNGGFASAVATLVGGGTRSYSFGPTPSRQAIGPFSEGASVVLTNQSAVLDYDFPFGNVPTFSRDTSGNITGLVDGAGNQIYPVPSALWATRTTLAAAGTTSAFFTDVGVGGSYWFYAGGRWRPSGGRVTLKNLTSDVSNNAAPKVVMDYATILAGVWQDGDIIRAHVVKERTGGTSDTDATDMMLGTVAATLGTTLNLTTSALATTAISLALDYAWRRVSSTSVRSQGVPGATGTGTSTSANSLITGLSNLDSVDTYLQVTSDLTTAGGEVAWLRGYTVELIAGS